MNPTGDHADERTMTAVASPRTDAVPAVDSEDDARLLARLAGGERAALTEIYERHAGEALSLAAQICGAHAAPDVVDAACLVLWRQARAAHRDGPSRARLLRITRQRALDHLHDDHHRVGSGPGAATHPTAPVSLIELSDADAHAALRAVPPAERHCVSLAYLDGLSVGQIAALTGQPPATVSDHLRRGIDHARRHLTATHSTHKHTRHDHDRPQPSPGGPGQDFSQ